MLAVVVFRQPFQIFPHLDVRFAAVGRVDAVVGVFDVDDEVVDEWRDRLQRFRGYVQRGFEGDFPAVGAEGMELSDECRAQQRFAPAETDSAARGHEVEVVDEQLLVERLWRVAYYTCIRIQTTGVQTVTTLQRTAVEGRKRGHALAIDADAVAVDADKGSLLRVHLFVMTICGDIVE